MMRRRLLITRWITRRSASAFALLGALAVLWPLSYPAGSSHSATATAAVRPFVDTLIESGTISAARMKLYGAPVGAGPSKIIDLVPEGTRVAPGDVLIRFDVSEIEAATARDQIALSDAIAARQQAQEALRLVQLEAAGAMDEAVMEAEAAERRAASERDGLGQLSVEETRAAADEARREETRTRTAHSDIAALLAEGFVTRAEVERAEQAHRRAQETLRLATLKLDLLTRFERPAAIARADAEMRSATRVVRQTEERAAARVVQQQAAAAAASAAVQAAETRLAALRERLAHAVVRADSGGIVVHRELYFGADRRKPQVGDEAWPNQPVVALPDSDSLVVDTEVREIDLHKIRPRQRVRVAIEAYPDMRLDAEVTNVGAVARDDPARVGTKRFPVAIRLVGSDERLRVGMTARVEIDVQVLNAALVVPSDAVFDDGGTIYCVVSVNGRRERRVVHLAGRNALEAAVASGLQPGDVVSRGDMAQHDR